MRHSSQKRPSRRSRRPRIERLTDRALLAVLGVAPGPDDNAAALFAEAIATANSTAEPDTIELAAGTYDLASLENATIEVTSEISVRGVSPTRTHLIGASAVTALAVRETGTLGLSQLTIFASATANGGALSVEGVASLNEVAVIGIPSGGEVIQDELQYASLIRGNQLDIANSAIVDAAGVGVYMGFDFNPKETVDIRIDGSIISGSTSFAVQGVSNSVAISDTTIFDNGRGVSVFGPELDVLISGSTISGNQNPLDPTRHVFGPNLGTPGVTLLTADPDRVIDIADDNFIVGNQADTTRSEVAITLDQTQWRSAIGDLSQADTRVAAVSATTEIVDGKTLLRSDQDLEGVNVTLTSHGDDTIVKATGRGSSSVFWDPAANQFFIDSKPRSLADLIDFSARLATIDAGEVVGGGSWSRYFGFNFGYSQSESELTATEKNTWNYLRPTEFVAQSGARIVPREQANGTLDFDYEPPADFEGTDTITVRGVTALGEAIEGKIKVDVVLKTGITVNVAASELDDVIEVAISTSGLGNVTSFNMTLGYDPQVVKLVDSEEGREFPFTAEAREQRGSVNLSALGGFSRGSDLAMLRFVRIGDGSAGIELLGSREITVFAQTFTESSFSAYFRGQRIELAGFDQAYYYLSQDDVNRDGEVSARDALNVVNRLGVNAPEAERSSTATSYLRDFDTNGDGEVSASDSLRIINRLGRQNNAEGESAVAHPIFSSAATTFLDQSKAIPTFVARPGLAIDDGSPVDGVNVAPPTTEEKQAADTIELDENGVSLERSLADIDDEALFVIKGTGAQVGFGLMPIERNSELLSDLTLAFFREDGSLIEAYPNESSQRAIGGAIDTTGGERIYIRIGTTGAESLDYRLELLEFTSPSETQTGAEVELDALAVMSRQGFGEALAGVEGYQWMQGFGPDSGLGDDIHADESADATLIQTFQNSADFVTWADASNDVDWFRVPTHSDEVLVGIHCEENTRVRFEVFDGDVNLIESDTTINRSGNLEAAGYNVRPGSVILIRVEAESIGKYSFGITDTGSQERTSPSTDPTGTNDQIGDSLVEATDLTLHPGGLISLSQTIESRDDVDVYRIPNALPGTLIVSGIEGIEAELLDASGQVIEPRSDGFQFSDSRLVIENYAINGFGSTADAVVYLRVSSSEGFTGSYHVRLSLEGQIPELPADFEPFDVLASARRPDSNLGDDPHGETIRWATTYSNDEDNTRTSFLDAPGDVDVFRFKNIGRAISFSVHSDEIDSIQLRAFGEDGVELPYLLSRRAEGQFGISIGTVEAPKFFDSQGNTRHAFYIEVSSTADEVGQYTLMRGIKGNVGIPVESLLATPDAQFVHRRQWAQTALAENDEIFGFDSHSDHLAGASEIQLTPIEHYLSSFLDGPGDRDAFTFAIDYSEAIISFARTEEAMALRGEGGFDVFDADGNLVEPVTEVEDDFENYTSDFVQKTYQFDVGRSYTFIAANDDGYSFGSYGLLFVNGGNVLDSFNLESAVDLTIPAGREGKLRVSGQIDDAHEVDLYRISSNALTFTATLDTLAPFRSALYDAETGQKISETPVPYSIGVDQNNLPSATDNVTRDYIFAVWNHNTTGPYDVDLLLRQQVVEVDDIVGETIEDATPVAFEDREGTYSTWRSAQFEVHLNSADDVDVFSFTAESYMTTISAGELDHHRDAKHRGLIVIDVFDAEENQIVGEPIYLEDDDNFSINRVRISTTPGEIYHIRFSQLSTNPLALHVSIN